MLLKRNVQSDFNKKFSIEWRRFLNKHEIIQQAEKKINFYQEKLNKVLFLNSAYRFLDKCTLKMTYFSQNMVESYYKKFLNRFNFTAKKNHISSYIQNSDYIKEMQRKHSFNHLNEKIIHLSEKLPTIYRPTLLSKWIFFKQKLIKLPYLLRESSILLYFLGESDILNGRKALKIFKKMNGGNNIVMHTTLKFIESEFLPKLLHSINNIDKTENLAWLKEHCSEGALSVLDSLKTISVIIMNSSNYYDDISYDIKPLTFVFHKLHVLHPKSKLYESIDDPLLFQPSIIVTATLRCFSDNESTEYCMNSPSEVNVSMAITYKSCDKNDLHPLYLQELQFLDNHRIYI